jgi:integrase
VIDEDSKEAYTIKHEAILIKAAGKEEDIDPLLLQGLIHYRVKHDERQRDELNLLRANKIAQRFVSNVKTELGGRHEDHKQHLDVTPLDLSRTRRALEFSHVGYVDEALDHDSLAITELARRRAADHLLIEQVIRITPSHDIKNM